MSSQPGNGLQDDLIDHIISGLDEVHSDSDVNDVNTPTGGLPQYQEPGTVDGGFADFDIDMLLSPIIQSSNQSLDASSGVLSDDSGVYDGADENTGSALASELDGPSDADMFNELLSEDYLEITDESDLTLPTFDPAFLDGEEINPEKRPPLTSLSIPGASNAISQSQIEQYVSDEDSLFSKSEISMLEDEDYVETLEDAPVNVLTDFTEPDAPELIEEPVLAEEVLGSSVDLELSELDFPGIDNVSESPATIIESQVTSPQKESLANSSSTEPGLDDMFLPQIESMPDDNASVSTVEFAVGKASEVDDSSGKNLSISIDELPDFVSATSDVAILKHSSQEPDFDLGEALGGIRAVEDSYQPHVSSLVQDGGDADRYHLRLEQENPQQDFTPDSTSFLKSPGVSEQSENYTADAQMESPMTPSSEKKKTSISSIVISVAAAVLLSSAGTWWLTTSGPSAQKTASDFAALKSDFDSLKKSINTLQSATQNGEGVTLISAYEALSKKQDELNKEQAQLLIMLKSQSENSAQFEKDMIDRFELIVNYAKSVSDQQLQSEQKMRGEIAQTVVSEVSAKTAGIDKSKIVLLENELKVTQQRMSEMQKDVKQQAELVSLLEGETDFVRGQLQDYKRKSTLAPSVGSRADGKQPQVSVRPSGKSQTTESAGGQFSSSLSEFTLIGVHNGGENGFSIFVQSKEDLGTSAYDTYYFKPGETTQIPGYGNILEVQDMPGSAYAVSYQVITERGVIRGRPQ